MKMAILELEYKNIRKITALKLPFTKADGSVISNNFIMMANGTGKTTTMELIKGLFDGTAAGWTASKVRSFAPTLTEADTGEFSITVKFDDRQYKYFLSMNYKDGTVQVETSAPPKGREAGLRLPESIRGIFTPEFVRRFVFDGEQAAKSMDSSSNEADETIRYLYRLDELDEILGVSPGSVGPLGILNDTECRVHFYMDDEFKGNRVGVHPNENTATLWMSADDLLNLIQDHGNIAEYVRMDEICFD